MTMETIPVVGSVFRTGADDRWFDTLLLLGPVLLASIAILGRQPVTIGLTAGYVIVFLAHTLHNWVRTRRPPEMETTRR